jgi:hypothetical protein
VYIYIYIYIYAQKLTRPALFDPEFGGNLHIRNVSNIAPIQPSQPGTELASMLNHPDSLDSIIEFLSEADSLSDSQEIIALKRNFDILLRVHSKPLSHVMKHTLVTVTLQNGAQVIKE